MSWPLVPDWVQEFSRDEYFKPLPPIIDRDPGDETEYDNHRG